MKYILLFVLWLFICAINLIWEFKIVPIKELFKEKKDLEQGDYF